MSYEDGLGAYLKSLKYIKSVFPTLSSHFVPRHTIKTITELEKKFGDIEQRDINGYELHECWNRVSKIWGEKSDLKQIKLNDLRKVPWVLFYPHNDESHWLVNDTRFLDSYFSWLEDKGTTRTIKSLIYQFLVEYPDHLPTFGELLKRLEILLTGKELLGLRVWKERSKRYKLFESNAPQHFASIILDSQLPLKDIFEQAGMVKRLAVSNFLSRTSQEILNIICERLINNNISVEKLKRFFEFIEIKNGKIRFQEQSFLIADSLLMPFANKRTSPEIQESVQNFLLRCLGDPRITPGNWIGVSEASLNVMKRWLVGATLEDFFRLLDHTALDRHWKYRKAFWTAYLERGYISDAWVLLGHKARAKGREVLSKEISRYGSLTSKGDITPDQSVILLKVGMITVTEWSHNGKCRLWLPDNPHAPKFYQKQYRRNDLVINADFEQIHHASERGTWQRKVARWIEDQTGIHLNFRDYMLRI